MPSKHFHELIDKCKEIHDRKSHDYSKDDDSFSNFTFAAELVKHFKNPIDQVFVGIIGIKIARLSELCNGKIPNNESIDDTYIDLTNYCALWGAYKLSMRDNLDIKLHPCPKCTKTFMDLHLYVKHAEDMHSAKFNPKNGELRFSDNYVDILPSLIYLLDDDIPF